MVSPFHASTFLPHLSGLRALAIVGILLYHLRAAYCPAGYFGVDVFLVLSGFLLLRRLVAESAPNDGIFRYGNFLLNKAWRLLPAWFVATVVTVLAACLLLHPAQLGTTALTAASSAACCANTFIDHSGDYFNPLSRQNPLLHLWYLSLTQQFYLLLPLLLVPMLRLGSRRAALILLALLALLSLAFYLLTATPNAFGEALLHGIGARTVYYQLIPRFWEVAAGGFIFLLPAFDSRARLRAVLGLSGLAGIATSFYLYDTGSTAVYMAVVSTLLAIRYGAEGPAARLLTLRPVQALGCISFSLYLWHWPLMVFWKYCCFDNPSVPDELGMLAVSVLAGYLGWRFVERLRPPALHTRWAHAALLLCLPLVAGGGFLLHARAQQFAHMGTLGHAVLIHHAEQEQDAAVLRGLERLPQLRLVSKPLRIGTAEAEASFLLIGDSHAQHLYDALHKACAEAGLRGLYLNNTVAPYHGLIQPRIGADTCRWNAEIEGTLLAYLGAHPGIRHVLIAQCWQMRMGEGYAEEARTGQPLRSRKARHAVTGPGIGLFCDRLRAAGCVPVLLGETPRFPRPCPLEEWHRREMLGLPQRARRMSVAAFEEAHAFPLATLRALAAEGRAELIELTPALRVGDAYPANEESNEEADEKFWYYDANHLTPTAARRVVNLCIMPQLQRLLTPPH